MKKFIILSVFLFTLCQVTLAQSVLISTFPNVQVKIRLLKNDYKSFDSVKFEMTITNLSDSIQSLLFDRPLKNYPWGTFAILIFDETHDTLSAKVNTEILSSTLYAKEDLKKTGAFYDLRPKQILKHTYRLADIAILKNYERTLKPGKYHFFLQYYINKSNEATFTIKK